MVFPPPQGFSAASPSHPLLGYLERAGGYTKRLSPWAAPHQQIPDCPDFFAPDQQALLREEGILFEVIEVCVGDAYLIKAGTIHYFHTTEVEQCSFGWNMVLDMSKITTLASQAS